MSIQLRVSKNFRGSMRVTYHGDGTVTVEVYV